MADETIPQCNDAATPTNWSSLNTPDDGTPDPTTETSTLADVVAPAPPASLTVVWAKDEAAMLTWVAPGDDDMTGLATTYDLRISSTPSRVSSSRIGAMSRSSYVMSHPIEDRAKAMAPPR